MAPLPVSQVYPTAATAPAPAASTGNRKRSASAGNSASSFSITTIAAPTTAVTCSPLIDNRCARPERRIASASSSLIAPRSPVASVAAIAPADPPTCSRTCADSRARIVPPGCPAGLSTSISPKARPVAPSPSNHATRSKSQAPGTAGGAGAINRARSRNTAPLAMPSTIAVSATLTRSIGGRSGASIGAIRKRTIWRAGKASTRSTVPVKFATTGRASTGSATRSARNQISAHPNASASAPIPSARMARPPRGSINAPTPSAQPIRITALQAAACGSANHRMTPVPIITGSHRIN